MDVISVFVVVPSGVYVKKGNDANGFVPIHGKKHAVFPYALCKIGSGVYGQISGLVPLIQAFFVHPVDAFLQQSKDGGYILQNSLPHFFAHHFSLSHSASLKPTSTKSSPMMRGRFTSMPLVAKRANCSSSLMSASLSFSCISL